MVCNGYMNYMSYINILYRGGGLNPAEKHDIISWDKTSQLNGKRKTVPNHQPVYKPPKEFGLNFDR